jgi:epoxyqueuosine reductase
MSQKTIKTIFDQFRKEGFSLVGILNRDDCHFGDWLSSWLRLKHHADMVWMEKNRAIRENPCRIEDYAQSVISTAISYHTKPPENWKSENPISNYAWGEDYHQVLKKKLKSIVANLSEEFPDLKARVFVDTAPLPEKLIAMRCGLGWVGKNSMLINRKLGSYLFLGEVITNLDLPTTGKLVKNYCGTCTKCIDACPTGAINSNGSIDSNRCLSYLTIEKRDAFNETEKGFLEYQIFGCDICQQVCPWNKKAPLTDHKPFSCSEKWTRIDSQEFVQLTREQFDLLKIKSPIKRAKYEGFIRNAKAIKANRK